MFVVGNGAHICPAKWRPLRSCGDRSGMHSTIFFDIGGVFLTNGWDRPARERTTVHFGIASEEFEARHRAAVDDFETGRLGLDAYLDRTVFHQPRTFARDAVIQF